MKKQHSRLGLISLAVFALLSAGHGALRPHSSEAAPTGAAASPILLHLSVEKEAAGGDGPPSWAALTEAVQPGDDLRYTLQVRNRGAVSVRNLVVTQPVPAGMSYRADSAQGLPTYSLDGKTFSVQPTVPFRQADGTVQRQPAAPDAYKSLRWRFALMPAGSAQSVTYQVKVR